MNKVLITGATSGIGLEFARIYAEQGRDLIIHGRNLQKLSEVEDELRNKYQIDVLVVVKDLTEPDAAEYIYEQTQTAGATVDILINNAGFGQLGEFTEIELGRDTDMIQVNVTALMQLSKLFARAMKQRGEGGILNVASIASFLPGPHMNVYYATKAFVLSFSTALSEELRGTGVRVTALCPGYTKTDFQKEADFGAGKSSPAASAREVAALGVSALARGQTVAVPGLFNKILVATSQMVPVGIKAKMSSRINKNMSK